VGKAAAQNLATAVGRRAVAKVGQQWEIPGCADGGLGPTGSALHEKISLPCREQAKGVYHSAVFEVKKEIPDKYQ
jgi:hypothetical protein